MTTLSVDSAVTATLPELADLFTRAFTGYIGGPVHLTDVSLAGFLAREDVDLTRSQLLLRDGERIGIGFIARQGWTSRLAAMGVIPDSQSKGLGTWFMEQLITQAKARQDHTMVLEAFEQNTRAVKLYERVGFRIVRRLLGYTGDITNAAPGSGLTEIDVYEVARQIMIGGASNLPWQMSATSLARFGPPFHGYQLGDAYAIISDPAQETLVLRALYVSPAARRKGAATRLLGALAAANPGKKWSVPALCPEEYGRDFLEKRGFTRTELNQVQMELTFTA